MAKHTSNELRARLINMVFNKNIPLKDAASNLDIKYITAYKICKTFTQSDRIEKRKSKGRKTKFGSNITNTIIKFFERNSDETLAKCQKFIQNENPDGPVPSIATIDRILSKSKISFKNLAVIPEQRNNESTIALRKRYAIRYTRLEGSVNFIFIDEFGCNMSLRRRKGRSKIGTSATINAPGARGNNLSVCAAIDINGPIYHKFKLNAFNQDHFIAFLTELKEKLDVNKCNYLVFDNVAFHKTAQVQNFLKENSLKFLFLPPWSPMLNPIEECFSKVKNFIKMNRSTCSIDLKSSVDLAIEKVTASDCQGWFRHAKLFFTQCLNEQPIRTDVEPNLEFDDDEDPLDYIDSDDELLQENFTSQ